MPSAEHEAVVAVLLARRDAPVGSIADQRAGMEAMTAGAPIEPGSRIDAVDAGGVPAEWVIAPGARSGSAVLYLHGGGYAMGSVATHRSLASRISAAAGLPVLVIDYRLAPEHPWPAAVDDAWTAWRWLREQGFAGESLAIGGDSAGGGLALALLQRIRADGDGMPACAVCLSPWTDLEGTGASVTAADDPMVRIDGLHEMAAHYVGNAADDEARLARLRHPELSPLHADFDGFPPLLIQVGTRELLLDDSTRVAERAVQAGVEVVLEVEDGLIHVWQALAMLPESIRAVERIGAFLSERVSSP